MPRESCTLSTLGEPIPHTGVESDLHCQPYTMKLKKKLSFGPPQDRPLLLSISGPPGPPSRLTIPFLSPAKRTYLGANLN